MPFNVKVSCVGVKRAQRPRPILAQNEHSCHQWQCSCSVRLFKCLWEATNRPKGLCQNLSQQRSGGTLIGAWLVKHKAITPLK